MIKITNKQLADTYAESIKIDGFFNIFVYRKISIIFTWIFAALRLTPNFITVSSFVFVLMASVFFSLEKNMIYIGLIFFNIGVILDNADGQLAILTNQKTKLGEFIDPFLDKIGWIAILTGLAYSYYHSTVNLAMVYLYILWIIIYCLCLIVDNAAEQFGVSTGLENLRETRRIIPAGIRRYIRWDGGFTAVLTTILVIFGYIPLLIIIDMIVSFIPHLFTLIQLIKHLRSK
jgi:phosphatidylglycerophosphate synthase